MTDISELFNARYEVLLQMLIRYFIHALETEDQLRTLSSTAVDMMFVAIKPLGELLTTSPVGPKYPERRPERVLRSTGQDTCYPIVVLPG